MKKHSQNDEAESLPVVGLLALAMISTPAALSLGVPAGTWLGNLLGWRLSFALMSGLSVTLIARIILVVPYFPGQAVGQKMRLTRALLIPGIRPIPVGVLTWMLAHNILYSYIPPSCLRPDCHQAWILFCWFLVWRRWPESSLPAG